jgi:hypothetical protein
LKYACGATAAVIVALFVSTPFMTDRAPQGNDVSNPPVSPTSEKALRALDSVGGYFTENGGQVNGLVRYYSNGNPAVAFREDGVMFVIKEAGNGWKKEAWRAPADHFASVDKTAAVKSYSYMLRFEGANRVMPAGRDRLPFNSNFFIGNDPARWKTDVPIYREVIYENLYDGVDFVYRSGSSGVKYELVVHPGADLRVVSLSYDGVESVLLDDAGMLVRTILGETRDTMPYAYLDSGEPVNCMFVMHDEFSYGFGCEAWDSTRQLIIDPLIYSTYIGGTGGDGLPSITVDGEGSAYVIGDTMSSDFPITPGAFDTAMTGYGDIFVIKLNVDGSSPVYSTFLGGNGGDFGRSIVVDSVGAAYLSGGTNSADFPMTTSSFDRSLGGTSDAIVAKLNPAGSVLLYSTYLGGNDMDYSYSVAMDSEGNAYATGYTYSTDFPVTPSAFDTSYSGNGDIFVTKLNVSSGAIVFSTYLGGATDEGGASIVVDSNDCAIVAGDTSSAEFPTTPGAFSTTFNGNRDAFVTKFGKSGDQLIFSTFIGGSSADLLRDFALGPGNDVFVAGQTTSNDFPVTAGAYDITVDGFSGFVASLDSGGGFLHYATFFGGAGQEDVWGLAVDSSAIAYVGGNTDASDFPVTPNAFDTSYNGGTDAYLSKFSADGSALMCSTFFGGAAADRLWSVAVDAYGYAYGSGDTYSTDLPTTPGAFSTSYKGFGDNFAMKLLCVSDLEPPDLAVAPRDILFDPKGPSLLGSPIQINVTVHNVGGSDASQVVARFFDGAPAIGYQIGTDQNIATILGFSGIANASVTWVPGQAGVYAVCVAIDPDNLIAELNENNNQACLQLEVLVPKPDLVVTSAWISFSPLPPFVEGSTTTVIATIRNLGTAASTATVARFYDGTPPAPQIEQDQPVNTVQSSERTDVSVDWTAHLPTIHRLCVYVDPEGVIDELDETNNQACVSVYVLSLPDLQPRSLTVWPSSSVVEGTTLTVNFTMANEGDDSADNFDVLVFDDTNGNLVADSGEHAIPLHISSLSGHSQERKSVSFEVLTLGDQAVCVIVDPEPGHVVESNETNNMACTSILVKEIRADANWKPLVALTFVLILAGGGLWSSMKRPWRGETKRKAVLKTFTIASVPFILAESVTGVVSLLTGWLSIPPAIGVGTVVDLIILLAGLGVAILRALKAKPSKVEMEDEQRKR